MRLRTGLLLVFTAAGGVLAPYRLATAQDITTGLRGHWKLDESSGTTAVDSSGQGANGAYAGSPDLGVSGRFGTAVDFSGNGGTTDYLSLPYTVLNGLTNVSLSFWIRTTNTSYHAIVSGNSSSVDNEYFVFIDTGGLLKVRYKNNSNSVSWALSNIYDGNWHHIVVATNNSTDQTTVYQDSVSLGSQTVSLSGTFSLSSGGLILGQDQDCLGGCFDSTQRLIGRLDQIRIYNRVLAVADIEYLYAEGAPLLHWKLDEASGATAADSSGFGRTGSVVGTATWIAGRRRNAFDFNGSSRIETTNLLGKPSSFTIACWARIDSADTSGAEGVSVGDYLSLRVHNSSAGGPSAHFYYGSGYRTASIGTSYIATGWHHFAATFDDSANSLVLYIDGAAAASLSTTSSISWSGLGTKTIAGAHGNGNSSYDLNGAMDDVRVYDRALTASEIVELYGLVGRWKLDETSGSVAADSSGFGNHGTYENGVTLAQSGPFTGGAEVAAQFDGSNDRVTTGSITSDLSEGFAIAAWARPTNVASWQRIVDFGKGQDVDNILLGRSGTTTTLILRVHDGSIGTGTVSATGAMETDVWHHYVATCDHAGNAKLYRDGQLIASGATGTPANVTRTINYIADSNWAADASYQGRIHDVRLYNRPLDSGEIAQIYGLVGRWAFDEGSGTAIADSSGSANNAAFNSGSPTWTAGVQSGALQFNGTTDDAITANDLVPPSTGTVAFWFRSNGAPASQQRLFGLSDNWEAWQNPDGVLRLDLGGDGDAGGFETLSALATAGTWYHIAAVYDAAADAFSLYVNGELHKSGTMTLAGQAGARLSFATRTGTTQRFAGALDDFRVYSRKLSAMEVRELYGLVGWYKLDELSGTVAADSSGMGRNGTYVGSPALGSASNGNVALGTAVDFSGSNYVQIPSLYGNPASVSVAAWAKLDAADASGADVVTLGDYFKLSLRNGNPGAVASYYNGATWVNVNLGQIVANTGWRHFAATLQENDSLKIYVDGKLAATAALSGTISYSGLGSNARIASHGNGSTSYDLDGRIDDVRIYNRAVQPAEVYNLYRGSRIDGVKILQWIEVR